MRGPAPDPNALRRDRKDDVSWTTLPGGVRKGPFPAWPLPTVSEREVELWESYWAKPQSDLWKRNAQEHEVAIFVRRVAEVEKPDAPTTLGVLVQHQMDALLLTIPAMYKARVQIASDEVGSRRSEKANGPVQVSARDRLKSLNVKGA